MYKYSNNNDYISKISDMFQIVQCSIHIANSAMIITYYKLHNRKGENHSLLKQFTRCVLISSCRTRIVPGFKPKGNGDRKTNSKNSTVI